MSHVLDAIRNQAKNERSQSMGTPSALPGEAYLFELAHDYWIVPCAANLPPQLHTMCVFLPAILTIALIMLPLALLAHRQQQNQIHAAKGAQQKQKKAD